MYNNSCSSVSLNLRSRVRIMMSMLLLSILAITYICSYLGLTVLYTDTVLIFRYQLLYHLVLYTIALVLSLTQSTPPSLILSPVTNTASNASIYTYSCVIYTNTQIYIYNTTYMYITILHVYYYTTCILTNDNPMYLLGPSYMGLAHQCVFHLKGEL